MGDDDIAELGGVLPLGVVVPPLSVENEESDSSAESGPMVGSPEDRDELGNELINMGLAEYEELGGSGLDSQTQQAQDSQLGGTPIAGTPASAPGTLGCTVIALFVTNRVCVSK